MALGGAIAFGTLAWLGLMVVEPGRQRQGLGGTVAHAAIDWARGRGCSTICLIATSTGIPLYRRLGFVPDGDSHEVSGAPRPLPLVGEGSSVRPWTPEDTAEVASLDAPAFGAESNPAARRLRPRVLRVGVGCARRPWTRVRVHRGAGQPDWPWCAVDKRVAGRLVDVALGGITRTLRVGVLDEVGARLLASRGLVPGRSLARMRLGPSGAARSACPAPGTRELRRRLTRDASEQRRPFPSLFSNGR